LSALALLSIGCSSGNGQQADDSADGGGPSSSSAVTIGPIDFPDAVTAGDTFDSAGLLEGPRGLFVPFTDPEMVAGAEADWIHPDDIVLGVTHPSGEAQAFPISQMAYHHIANITIAGEPYLVTY
jgi:hypothetical protein